MQWVLLLLSAKMYRMRLKVKKEVAIMLQSNGNALINDFFVYELEDVDFGYNKTMLHSIQTTKQSIN